MRPKPCAKPWEWFMILAFVPFGGIAQLGERLHGMQEVSGSIPLTSTNRQSAVGHDQSCPLRLEA
ncbi:hypothetical protein THIX_30466 [Thiomonas sp. X19]|nr:hypothetical protein THIX_30466 [Thiomonas sp. X19]